MLFRKKIDRSCSYCLHCTTLNSAQVLCSKRGIMPLSGQCRQFRYDPCKRIPGKPKALDLGIYEHEDYSL